MDLVSNPNNNSKIWIVTLSPNGTLYAIEFCLSKMKRTGEMRRKLDMHHHHNHNHGDVIKSILGKNSRYCVILFPYIERKAKKRIYINKKKKYGHAYLGVNEKRKRDVYELNGTNNDDDDDGVIDLTIDDIEEPENKVQKLDYSRESTSSSSNNNNRVPFIDIDEFDDDVIEIDNPHTVYKELEHVAEKKIAKVPDHLVKKAKYKYTAPVVNFGMGIIDEDEADSKKDDTNSHKDIEAILSRNTANVLSNYTGLFETGEEYDLKTVFEIIGVTEIPTDSEYFENVLGHVFRIVSLNYIDSAPQLTPIIEHVATKFSDNKNLMSIIGPYRKGECIPRMSDRLKLDADFVVDIIRRIIAEKSTIRPIHIEKALYNDKRIVKYLTSKNAEYQPADYLYARTVHIPEITAYITFLNEPNPGTFTLIDTLHADRIPFTEDEMLEILNKNEKLYKTFLDSKRVLDKTKDLLQSKDFIIKATNSNPRLIIFIKDKSLVPAEALVKLYRTHKVIWSILPDEIHDIILEKGKLKPEYEEL